MSGTNGSGITGSGSTGEGEGSGGSGAGVGVSSSLTEKMLVGQVDDPCDGLQQQKHTACSEGKKEPEQKPLIRLAVRVAIASEVALHVSQLGLRDDGGLQDLRCAELRSPLVREED